MKLSLFFLVCAYSLLTSIPCLGQEGAKRTISGVVYDSSSSEVLIGATILIQNTVNGTITDIDGHFQLDVPMDEEVVLVVSYTGTPIEIKVNQL